MDEKSGFGPAQDEASKKKGRVKEKRIIGYAHSRAVLKQKRLQTRIKSLKQDNWRN